MNDNGKRALLRQLYNAYLENTDENKDLVEPVYDDHKTEIALLYKLNFLSDKVFLKDRQKEIPRYNCSRDNPLTEKGEAFLNRSWIDSLKEIPVIKLVIILVVASGVIAGLLLTILQIITILNSPTGS